MNDEERQGRSRKREKTPKKSPAKIGSSKQVHAPETQDGKKADKSAATKTKSPAKSKTPSKSPSKSPLKRGAKPKATSPAKKASKTP